MDVSSPAISIFNLLFLASLIHGLFLTVLVYGKKHIYPLNVWLSSLLILVSAWVLNYLFYTTGWIQLQPHLLDVLIPPLYLIGPLLFLISSKVADQSFQFRKVHSLHFIPFLLTLAYYLPGYFDHESVKLEHIATIYSQPNPSSWHISMINKLAIVTAIYSVISYFNLKRRSNKHLIHRRYQIMLLVFTIILILILALPFVCSFLQVDGVYIELGLVFLLSIAIHLIGYASFHYTESEISDETSREGANLNGKYHTSPLDPEEIDVRTLEIRSLLNKQQLWKDPGFSMDTLAEQLNLPRHHLSQILNAGMNLNFYDLVNQYRVEEVIHRIDAGDHLQFTIGAIGLESGFNSLSTFHRAFKKITGKTPSQYAHTAF